MLGNLRIDDFATEYFEPTQRPFLVRLDQPRKPVWGDNIPARSQRRDRETGLQFWQPLRVHPRFFVATVVEGTPGSCKGDGAAGQVIADMFSQLMQVSNSCLIGVGCVRVAINP